MIGLLYEKLWSQQQQQQIWNFQLIESFQKIDVKFKVNPTHIQVRISLVYEIDSSFYGQFFELEPELTTICSSLENFDDYVQRA